LGILRGVGAAIELDLDMESRETRRRQLMARSDALLEEVEQLLLQSRGEVLPDRLAEAIGELEVRLARTEKPNRVRSARAAHRLVLAVQQRLMASNPLNLQPRQHPGRAPGIPTFKLVGDSTRWKFLTLPTPPSKDAAESEWKDWRERAEQVVDRANDRWACALHQAQAAARAPQRSGPAARGQISAVVAARAAWQNYWELSEESARLAEGPGP